jgi:phage gpG-like protein
MAGIEIKVNEAQLRSVQRSIERITPSRNAEEIVGREFLRWAQDTVRISKTEYLRGPRPHRLGVVTGRLINSISPDWRGRPWAIAVGTDVKYGKVHELGLGRMPKRPFLKPAGDKAAVGLAERLNRRWVGEWSG